MSQHDLALALADALDAAVQTHPQMSEDEPGGYCTDVDMAMADAAALLRQWPEQPEAKPVAWQRLETDPDVPPHWRWVECSKWEYDNCSAKGQRRELFAAPPDQTERIAALEAAAREARDALEYTSRRLQCDIDDGSRPDQWTMEDIVRKASTAIAALDRALGGGS